MSNRIDQEREKKLQPLRIKVAVDALTELGIEIIQVDGTKVQFYWEESKVTLFPYSGWHSGKTIKDGRGLQNLLNQLKQK